MRQKSNQVSNNLETDLDVDFFNRIKAKNGQELALDSVGNVFQLDWEAKLLTLLQSRNTPVKEFIKRAGLLGLHFNFIADKQQLHFNWNTSSGLLTPRNIFISIISCR